jgi:hypothetical protein
MSLFTGIMRNDGNRKGSMRKAACLSLIGLLVACGQSADSSDALPASQVPSDASSIQDFGGSTSLPGLDAGHGWEDGLGSPQSWTGYIENCKLLWDGSDAIHLEFGTDTTGQVIGTLKFGNPSLQIPPATDPNLGYPPGYKVGSLPNWYEGFDFSLHEGKLSPSRLQFSVDRYELWAGWCALQSPDLGGMCLPNWGGTMSPDDTLCTQISPTTGQAIVVDCGKFDLCISQYVCDCSGVACKAVTGHVVMMDIAFSGDSANGSMVDPGGDMCGWSGSYTIHLVRVP